MRIAKSNAQNARLVGDVLWGVTRDTGRRGIFLLSLLYGLLAVLLVLAGLEALRSGSAAVGGLQIATGGLLSVTGLGLWKHKSSSRTSAQAISWVFAVVGSLLAFVCLAIYVVLWFGGVADESFLFRTLAYGGGAVVVTCLGIQSICFLSTPEVRRAFESPNDRNA